MIRLAVGTAATNEVLRVVNDSQRVAAVQRALEGRSFILTLDDTEFAAEIYDEMRRITTVRIVSAEKINEAQRQLLDLIGEGESVAAAAAKIGVSLRSAHRLLAAARSALDAPTNLAAIVALRATDDPRPPSAG